MPKQPHIGQYTIIDENVTIGDNVYIGNFVHIRPNVVIGDNTEIRDYCFLAEGCTIGHDCRIFQYADIGSGSIIGNYCYIGAKSILTNDKTLKWPKANADDWIKQPVIVEDYVRIGVGVVVLPNVILMRGSRIGAGAVVSHSTEPGKTYIGVPATCKEELG